MRTNIKSYLKNIVHKENKNISLVDSIAKVKQEWEDAETLFKEATDPILIEHAIHLMEAYERKYTYLLVTAQKENINNHNGPAFRG